MPGARVCTALGSAVPWESLLFALLIVALRAVDMSLDTLRISFIIQNRRGLASVVGFVEATTFIVAAGIVFASITDPIRIVGYGAGFALGQYLGLVAAERLRLGTVTVRIFSSEGPIGVAEALREAGFPVTTFNGEGRDGPVGMVHAVVRRRELPALLRACQPWQDGCYVTVGDEPVAPAAYPGAPRPGVGSMARAQVRRVDPRRMRARAAASAERFRR